jgi:hypothetical protein
LVSLYGRFCHSPESKPTNLRTLLQYKPLIVGIHRGGYKSGYFDADPKHSASIASKAFGVPFVAIDRSCYGGTTSNLPIPLGSTYPDECAKQLHHHILPKAWAKVGIPNNCNSIVILGHSLGTAVLYRLPLLLFMRAQRKHHIRSGAL